MRMRWSKLVQLMLIGAEVTVANLAGIPTVPFESSSKTGQQFDIHSVRTIQVDPKYASSVDTDGWTLIPPTLQAFGKTFAEDLRDVTGHNATLVTGAEDASSPTIFLTIGQDDDFKDAAGRFTSEAYKINVTKAGITLTGASPLGVFWATRTVLQQAILNHGKLALGSGIDAPGWGTRGVFLDAGRHYYPPSFIIELCNWMSFWKQNTFHIHLSDNLYNNVDIYGRERQLELYARFRPWSNDSAVQGLNLHANESYTREDFDSIQQSCAARGVTIIPEIESPGHALVFSQWKPELGLSDSLDLLNISAPDTIPTMQTIWDTFLPWFQSKVVHIGADEYVDATLSTYELGEDYNKFVTALNNHISAESGKEIRIWGTYPPQSNYTSNIAKNVTIQHWEFFEDNPLFDYINNGYSVINSDDSFYTVQKWSASYPQQLNRSRIFHGDPAGGAFAPNVFDANNATNNPPRDSPYVPGHIAAQWNDYGYNTSSYLEAYQVWRDFLPALADKQWGGALKDEDYDALFSALNPMAPGQNLDRLIKSNSSTILQYTFAQSTKNTSIVKDLSGNKYDGYTTCGVEDGSLQIANACSISTPLTSKGSNYTLSFTVKPASSTPGTVFAGPDSELRFGNGSSTAVMLVSAGNAFALNYSLPVGQWLNAKLLGRGNQTFFSVNNGPEMEFTTKIGVNGEYFVWAPMALVAPLQTVGGSTWSGAIKNITLFDYA